MESAQQAGARTCNPMLTLGGRVKQTTTITMLIALAVAAGLFLGWNSLVALGLSGIVLSVLPCLAMCALGICASRVGKKDGK